MVFKGGLFREEGEPRCPDMKCSFLMIQWNLSGCKNLRRDLSLLLADVNLNFLTVSLTDNMQPYFNKHWEQFTNIKDKATLNMNITMCLEWNLVGGNDSFIKQTVYFEYLIKGMTFLIPNCCIQCIIWVSSL